eukprot:g1889.t1
MEYIDGNTAARASPMETCAPAHGLGSATKKRRMMKEAAAPAPPPCSSALARAEELPQPGARRLLSISMAMPKLAKPFGVRYDVDRMMCIETCELHDTMKHNEMCHRRFCPDAPYLKFRRLLVDWMCEVGDEVNLHNSTMHVAVLFLDRMLQSTQVSRSQLQLVAIACTLIAAKLEEAEENVPSVGELNEFAQPGYNPVEVQVMEVTVLNKLGWSMGAITPLHYLGYYLSKGVVYEDDSFQGRPMIEKVPRYVQKYAEFFADLCLQDYNFQRYAPSLLAAAIVTASRKALHISGPLGLGRSAPPGLERQGTNPNDAPGLERKDTNPNDAPAAAATPKEAKPPAHGRGLWRPELEALTGTAELEMAPVMEHLWSHYLACFPTAWSEPATGGSPSGVAEFSG